MSYFILTDTSANLPTPVCEEWELERMPFAYILDGKEYTCMDTENFDDKEYYGKLRSGVRATTSMVAQETYYEAMTRRAANGDDVLYIGMSSGISGAYAASESASKRVREENPNVRIETFDTRGASLGEGLLVLEAARMRKAGASMDEVLAMLRNHRSRTQQVFTVDDLMHLQRGGRVSRVAAMVGSVLQIKPILESDELGRIIVTSKVRGRKKAVRYLADALRQKIDPNEKQLIGIAHADCKEDAETLKGLIRESCPNAQFLTVKYEPVTGAHVGPGALALFFLSKDRWR